MQLDAREEGVEGWQEGGDINQREMAARRAGRQLPRPGRLGFCGCHNGGMSRKSGFYIYTTLHQAAYTESRSQLPIPAPRAGMTSRAPRNLHEPVSKHEP